MKIYFTKIGIFRHSIKKVAEQALRYLGQPTKRLEMSLSVVPAEEMQQLNAQFRDVDAVTDVLSFPTAELGKQVVDVDACAMDTVNPQTRRVNLGDVIICVDKAMEQAIEYGHSLKREICFLTLHGLLHLLGYDHETPQDETEMTNLQKIIMDKAGITRQL